MCFTNPPPHHVWKCKIEPMWLLKMELEMKGYYIADTHIKA